MPDSRTAEAIGWMNGYADRTGLTSNKPPRRYLWTDAFAVCNFLSLARATRDAHYRDLAVRLVDLVHESLGRHRPDDRRHGWISGLSEAEGQSHPTRGGLRIGKELAERRPDQDFDEPLEWERDGQYFHYLTKWMHALDQVARATEQRRFNRWARELAETAHHAFTYRPASGSPGRMVWKMSIDLKRPLITSMGQHDPLDGYITDVELRATSAGFPGPEEEPNLEEETAQMKAMLEHGHWVTADPLGLGGLLADAYRVEQLVRTRRGMDDAILENLLDAALAGLDHFVASRELARPAAHRLAFRELGLAIGLDAVARMWQQATDSSRTPSARPEIRTRLEALMRHAPLGDRIESFWRAPEHQKTSTWKEHRDINEVMLATFLVPDGFVELFGIR